MNEIKNGKMEQDGFVYEEIGECYLKLGCTSKAKQYFKKSYSILTKDNWLVENEKNRLNRIKKLGGIVD